MTPDIILGPPGTGKTTTLLSVVDELLSSGVDPEKIAYVTFTRRGAEEAVQRACVRFSLEKKRFPYFRTLHSLCFRELGLKSSDVLEGSKLQAFSRYAGVKISGRGWSEDGTLTGFDQGDRILFAENLSRVREITLRQQYEIDTDRLPWSEVQRVSAALAKFKQHHGLMDYTDMLTQFVRENITIPVTHLIVDEAQDLSRLQWHVVEQVARAASRVYVAGDDDQAIYRWAGADVDYLINMRGSARVLGQSYRVPPAIQRVASRVISAVRQRREKKWSARTGADGLVRRAANFVEVDPKEDSVLVLARNSYVIREFVEPELRRQGVVFEKNGHSSIKPAHLEAITAWEALRAGKHVTVEQARAAYELMSSGRGVARGHKKLPHYGDADDREVSIEDLEKDGGLLTRAIWHEAMDRLPTDELSYIMAARRRGEKLRQRPRVRLATIHGSKGGEADHVVLMKEMAGRTYREMERNEEDEARVWYVGVTRAREKLTIVESTTRQACPWL